MPRVELRRAVAAVGASEGLHVHDLRHHAATTMARMPGLTTKELMARIGHACPAAALRYQHATAERDRRVADWLEDQISSPHSAPQTATRNEPRAARAIRDRQDDPQQRSRHRLSRSFTGGGDRNRTGVQGFAGPVHLRRNPWSGSTLHPSGERPGSEWGAPQRHVAVTAGHQRCGGGLRPAPAGPSVEAWPPVPSAQNTS